MCDSITYFKLRFQNSGARKKSIHDWHLILFITGLVLVDVTILTIYTTLQAVITDFTPGLQTNKEKTTATEGVSQIQSTCEWM